MNAAWLYCLTNEYREILDLTLFSSKNKALEHLKSCLTEEIDEINCAGVDTCDNCSSDNLLKESEAIITEEAHFPYTITYRIADLIFSISEYKIR